MLAVLVPLAILGSSCTDNPNAPEPPPPPPKIWYEDARWSPDGEKILYFVSDGDPSKSEIWIYNVNDAACRFVTSGRTPAWSPDGTQLAFSRDQAIWKRDLATGIETALTQDQRVFFPAWSPDGSRIAFDRTIPFEDRGIWIIDADGSNPVHFDTNGLGGRYPVWSPKGDELAFVTWDGKLYRGPVAGGPRVRLTSDSELNARRPTWSPDGTQIAFDIRRVTQGIGVVDLATGAVREIWGTISNVNVDQSCNWSPDSQSILYNRLELYVITLDGLENRLLLGSECIPPP